MAVFNMRVDPNTPVSRSLGFNPRGVMVDNITPYWLYFPQAEQYCPPFTSGWSAPFMLNMAGYGYMQIKTPFGQTVQTDVTPGVSQFVNLVWTDSDIGFSAGETSGTTGNTVDPSGVNTSSVSKVISTLLGGGAGQYITTLANVSGVWIPAVANKRHRLLTVTVGYIGSGIFPSIHSSPLELILIDGNTLLPVVYIALNIETRMQSLVFPTGLDLTVGASLDWQGNCYYADAFVFGVITSQVI